MHASQLMDSFCFQDEFLEAATLYCSVSPEPPFDDVVTGISDNNSSAFKRYFRPLNVIKKYDDAPNVHRRVIGMLKSIWKSKPNPKICKTDDGGGREFRHMMRERHRREKLSQNYSELYSILAPRSKADKNSIVQAAAAYIKELKIVKEELYRQNKRLKEKMDTERIEEEAEKIEVPLMNQVSTMDSVIEALQCVKRMGVTATSIRLEFPTNEFFTLMAINAKVEKSEVERAGEGTEMERKLRLQLQ